MKQEYALLEQVPIEELDLGYKEDFENCVFLLYKKQEIGIHRINGTIYTYASGAGRYQAGNLNLWFSRWADGDDNYHQLCNFNQFSGPGTRFLFCHCNYNGEEWVGLRHINDQAVNFVFVGDFLNINWQLIKYYNSNTQQVLNEEVNSSITTFDSDRLQIDNSYYATIGDIPDHVTTANQLAGAWNNTQSWNLPRANHKTLTMCSNYADGVDLPDGAPDRYWSGLNVGTEYTQFQLATYGGGTDAAQFKFRRQADGGANERWTPWHDVFCGIRKQDNITLPEDGSGVQIATAEEVETFSWILLDLNKYQDGIGDCHIMTISLSEKYNKTVMVPYYGSPAFIYMQLDFNDSGLYASISSGSGTFRIKGMTIFK